jgi:hypothetical protein
MSDREPLGLSDPKRSRLLCAIGFLRPAYYRVLVESIHDSALSTADRHPDAGPALAELIETAASERKRLEFEAAQADPRRV